MNCKEVLCFGCAHRDVCKYKADYISVAQRLRRLIAEVGPQEIEVDGDNVTVNPSRKTPFSIPYLSCHYFLSKEHLRDCLKED